MPTKTYTRRQRHGTRGTYRDHVQDWPRNNEVAATNALVVTLSDLGIKSLRPTNKELTKAANKLLGLPNDEVDAVTADDCGDQPVSMFSFASPFFGLFPEEDGVNSYLDPNIYYGDPQELVDLDTLYPLEEEDLEGDDGRPNPYYLSTGRDLGFPSLPTRPVATTASDVVWMSTPTPKTKSGTAATAPCLVSASRPGPSTHPVH